MAQEDRLFELSQKAWEFRKQNGFSKGLPDEVRRGAVELSNAGIRVVEIAKAFGVTKSAIGDWKKKFKTENSIGFKEATVVSERPAFEIKLSGEVQGCRIEITGSDFSLLQRLLRKLGD
jgi:transposase-like protein